MLGALDRDAVRRVLARATVLADVDPVAVEAVDGVAPEALLAAASEVGIPEDAVRRALTVEELGSPPGGRTGVLGPAVVVVDDELAGDAAAVLADLDRWLVGGHHL